MNPMREKLLWITVVILGVVLTASRAQTPTAQSPLPGTQVGRYQIIATQADSTYGVRVYRLDTVTGKTWMEALSPDHALQWSIMKDPYGPK
jgi:hypothetical protein